MKNKIKVLLVDDEVRFCENTSKLLIKQGFDTTIANNAEKAIQILKETTQDVIVLDVKMPGMDGFTALNEIKKIAPETQVIMLTGHGTKYSATRALVREAFDYLSKPCDVQILASRIHDAYMEKHQGFKIDDKKALNIMTRFDELVTVPADITVGKAMEKMSRAYKKASDWPLTIKKNQGFVLVLNEKITLTGILTRMDIIKAVRPEYVSAGESSDQDSSRFSSLFWNGFFSDRVKEIAGKEVWEIMSALPPAISENANLLEVAHLMWKESKRLLLVQDVSKVVGIISDQDIYGEIADVMKK
ncbi:MAG: response regulator [Proteobacteria bacterium]|nr:response regulator [Pseudomonadota bacterium]